MVEAMDGALRLAQRVGDLDRGEPDDMAQDQDLPLPFGQLVECLV